MKHERTQPCLLCPRECGVDRDSGHGFCGSGSGMEVASVTVHHGEEPVISGRNGICNVFFSGCNLRCVYCQNYQISRNRRTASTPTSSFAEIVGKIVTLLSQGIDNVGFVSPAHMVPQVTAIISELHRQGHFPVIVYNTNAYEKVETLRRLEGIVDVFLPDLKYADASLADRWSGAADYPQVARRALKEMYRQKGNRLLYADNGKLVSGMIVRHLVLPDGITNSIEVLRFLATELSPRLAVSIMAQYHPTPDVAGMHPLNRRITAAEYRQVVREVETSGFDNGWLQEFDSADYYSPDFSRPSPFQR